MENVRNILIVLFKVHAFLIIVHISDAILHLKCWPGSKYAVGQNVGTPNYNIEIVCHLRALQ